MNPYVVGFIFARGGSKGVPRKNVRLLAGKPLIGYAIETARASKLIDRVVVSTDDPEIAATAQRYGAEVPFMRPAELARDNSPEWLAWQHALQSLNAVENQAQIDIFVSIPPTSPLRTVEDVNLCIQTFQDSEADMVITVKAADSNPYFNMVTLNQANYAQLAIQPDQAIHRRQDAPTVYAMTTVAYVARPEFILNAKSMFAGKLKGVVLPAERAIDIDTELDFKFAEFLLAENNKLT